MLRTNTGGSIYLISTDLKFFPIITAVLDYKFPMKRSDLDLLSICNLFFQTLSSPYSPSPCCYGY